MRRRLNRSKIKGLLGKVDDTLRKFRADSVVYLATGGQLLGEEITGILQVPLLSLDIRYPVSRELARCPFPRRLFLWLQKELRYRREAPVHIQTALDLPPAGTSVILADDTASSGRTLELALKLLQERGFERDRVLVVVGKCGKGATGLVDVVLDCPNLALCAPRGNQVPRQEKQKSRDF